MTRESHMISIVMPVHNTGEYLNESIASILSQTYKYFELICIDDASDEPLTRKLLFQYQKKDKRIKLVTLEKNVGAAEARNIGMKTARGKYIMFLDADDIFDKVMLEKMFIAISDNNADICICGHRNYLNDKNMIEDITHPVQSLGITNRVFRLNELSEDGLAYWTTAPWNKMCRKEFLKEKDIYFQTLSSSNDVFFSCMCSICAERIVYCQNGIPLITYRRNTEYQISANRKSTDIFSAVSFLMERLNGQVDLLMYRQIMYLLIVSAVGNLELCSDDLINRKAYYLVQQYLQKNASSLVFSNKRVNNMRLYFMKEEYESNWFKLMGKFYEQLNRNKIPLLKSLHGKIQIVIWGNGARSKALQELLNENDICSAVVTDIKDERLGERTEYGYKIISTKSVEKQNDVIIATNRGVYKYLMCREELAHIPIIDLEKYCPFE